MSWTGYSFQENASNLYVKLVKPEFFENGIDTEARTTYTNISSMASYVITDVGSVQPIINLFTSESTDKMSILLVANDYNWYPSTVIARGAVIYDGAGNLICLIDFVTSQSSVGGTFNIPFSRGIIRIR